VAGEVLDGLVQVVGDDVDSVGFAGPAHRDVCKRAATAVFESVRDIDGRGLRAVDGDGVPVGEAVLAELLAGEAFETTVVHADRQRTVAEIDCFDDATFTGDDLATGSGGEGDDEVAGGIPAAVGCEVGSVEPPGDGPTVAGM